MTHAMQAAFTASPALPPSYSDTPSDLDLLDSMLEEGQAQAEEAASLPNDTMDFMDALIQESMQEKSAKEQLKEARKSIKNTRLPGSEIQRLGTVIRELELIAEWIAKADAIWIKRCVCEQCGSETPQFAGYFRHLVNRHTKVDRWVALSADTESTLPREMKVEMTTTPMCADCIPQILIEDGWLTAEAEDPFAENASAEEAEEEFNEDAFVPTTQEDASTRIWIGNTLEGPSDELDDSEVHHVV